MEKLLTKRLSVLCNASPKTHGQWSCWLSICLFDRLRDWKSRDWKNETLRENRDGVHVLCSLFSFDRWLSKLSDSFRKCAMLFYRKALSAYIYEGW